MDKVSSPLNLESALLRGLSDVRAQEVAALDSSDHLDNLPALQFDAEIARQPSVDAGEMLLNADAWGASKTRSLGVSTLQSSGESSDTALAKLLDINTNAIVGLLAPLSSASA